LALPSEEEVPEGPHRQLLIGLHRIYAQAGQPGLRKIAQGLKDDDDAPTTLNYQAIGKILNGRTIPTAPQLVSLALWLSKKATIPGKEVQLPIDALLEMHALLHSGRDQLLSQGDREAGEVTDSHRDTRLAGHNSERRLLGCMLKAKDAIADAVEVIAGDAFSDEFHSVILSSEKCQREPCRG
jgi:replicative DNA helicase